MSFDVLGEVNWLAVIVGGVIYFALGALWYSNILFGRQWQRSIGWDPERTPPEMNPTTYVVPFIAYLVMAAAVGMIAAAVGSDEIGGGVVAGAEVGVGVAAARVRPVDQHRSVRRHQHVLRMQVEVDQARAIERHLMDAPVQS